MFKFLSDRVLFQTGFIDFGDINKLIDKYYSKGEQFSRELAELQDDINNISYNTGMFLLLFIIIDIIILIAVFHYFRRKESYEKISRITMIIAIICAIPSFIYGYSFYDRPYSKEYSVPPYYSDAKNYSSQANRIEPDASKKQKNKELQEKITMDQYLERRNQALRDVDSKASELKQQGYRVIVRDDTIKGKVIFFISPPITNFALVGLWFGLQGFLFSLIICQAISLVIVWIKSSSEEDDNEQKL